MHGLFAMLVGRAVSPRVGETAFGAAVCAFFPILLTVVYGWARRVGLERSWSLVAVALVASVPTVYDVAAMRTSISAYVDIALAVYVALALEAVGRWYAPTWVVHGQSSVPVPDGPKDVGVQGLVPDVTQTLQALRRKSPSELPFLRL